MNEYESTLPKMKWGGGVLSPPSTRGGTGSVPSHSTCDYGG